MSQFYNKLPVLGFVAYSGTGKTTLLKQVIAQLRDRGIRVGTLKHTHHDFEIDVPGKDSYELRKAGAQTTLIASPNRWVLINENTPPSTPSLATMLDRFDSSTLDLLLIEGFKTEGFPKIELRRRDYPNISLANNDPTIIAIACDDPALSHDKLPRLDLNDPVAITDYVQAFCKSWLQK